MANCRTHTPFGSAGCSSPAANAGKFAPLLGWLRKNVHRHGRKFTPNELLERATGKPLTAAPWIAYVRQKFGALYGIKPARV